jgi:hypothetical protein
MRHLPNDTQDLPMRGHFQVMNYKILKRVELLEHHVETGRTVHRRGLDKLPKPSALEIIKYPNDPGYYLLYLDSNGDWQTDTYHDSIAKALDQAQYEFLVGPDDWEDIT